MIRCSTFLKKNPAMSNEEFHEYWLHKHSAVAIGTPSWFDYVRKYVQTHTMHAASPPDVAFDGAAQLTLDSFDAFNAWKNKPELDVIWADEQIVFDPPNNMWIISEDHEIQPCSVDPASSVKVVAIVRRPSDRSREEFQACWADEIALAQQASAGWNAVRGYTQAHTLPAADPHDDVADGFAEYWFADLESARGWLSDSARDSSLNSLPIEQDFMITYEVRKRP